MFRDGYYVSIPIQLLMEDANAIWLTRSTILSVVWTNKGVVEQLLLLVRIRRDDVYEVKFADCRTAIDFRFQIIRLLAGTIKVHNENAIKT